jgi:hypothetical protein
LNECTVRKYKREFDQLASDGVDSEIEFLPVKKRGRPLLLPDRLDEDLRRYLLALRE